MARGNRVQAQAFTQVVNAHGGLLEAPLKMTTGQGMTLVNPQSGKEVHCRVVRVDQLLDGCYPTAFEFDERNPQFWPVTFPPADWGVAQEISNQA